MSSKEENRGRSSSFSASASTSASTSTSTSTSTSNSELRRRGVQHAFDDSAVATPPRPGPSQAVSQLDQQHAAQRAQASRLSTIGSVASFVAPRAAAVLNPVAAATRSFTSGVAALHDTVDHLHQGQLRQGGASALSALGSAFALARVPLAPQVLSATSAALGAPETIQQNQGGVALAIAKARDSGALPKAVLEPISRQFKKLIDKQD